jgi:D-alanyl-D-alanine carboxypeptidase/D-alanyl-D-alanine-endopeptidase (penicillin-binding protein 4)
VLSRPRALALFTLALLNVFVIAAGVTLADLLRAHLALLAEPRVAVRPVVRGGAILVPDGGSALLPTPGGLAAALSPLLASTALGPRVGAVVTDPTSGRVLFSSSGTSALAPASTNKLATSVAALTVLGPDARFTTRVVRGASNGDIVLVGGGDPTLAAGPPPADDYPQPATLAALAAQTARALRAAQVSKVRLGYDTSLFTGPGMAPGWSASYVSTGDVTPVSALEVDQGRLTASGSPEDADDPSNYRPRSPASAMEAADAFASFLAAQGIGVQAPPRPERAAPGAAALAQVQSPPLGDLVEWMLIESNNDIAEALARQVAIATGRPASFGGGAAAVRAVLRGLGASAGIHTVDGSGLSPQDRITPAALARLISLAASPRYPWLRAVITGLPVAGFSGTLSAAENRFVTKLSAPAAGLVRAKTGTLDNVRALAGLVVDKDGRLLSFAFMINRVPAQTMTASATILDRLAAALAACGCR